MADLRASGLGGVPKGQTSDRPASPSIGDVFYNGQLGNIEIYTSNGWMAQGAAPQAPTVSATNSGSGRAYNNGRAAVTITPSSSGGLSTLYTITSSPGSFTATTSSTSVNIDGLQSNTSYTFTAISANNYATSAASSASSSITATTVPQAPNIGSATNSQNARSDVSFTSGATGGSAITSYTVTSSPGNITASGASSPITVTGLTNDTAYTFTVTATNANGTSAASSASSSVTPTANIYPTANLFARYDASDSSSITLSGSNVTTWNDLSGNSRHATQSSSSSRPIYNSTTINSLNTILFDGTNDYFNIANSTVLSGNFTIYFIGKNNYSGATASNGSFMIGSVESGLSFGVRNSSGTFQIIPEGTAAFAMLATGVNIPGNTSDSNVARQATLCWSGNGSGTVRWNKTANGTFNRSGFNPSQPITILGNYMSPVADNVYFKGEMAEILIYNTAHDLSTIQTIEALITSKWGA